MIEGILFYKMAFLPSSISSMALPIIGHHLTLRSKILELFFLTQLVALCSLLSHLFWEGFELLWTLIAVCFYFLGTYTFSKLKLEEGRRHVTIMALYLILLSLQYLLIGFFPQLDSHMTKGLFGNIVTISNFEAATVLVTFLIFFVFYSFNRKKLHRESLDSAFLAGPKEKRLSSLFILIPVILSLYYLGLTYTLSFLLIPSLIPTKLFPKISFRMGGLAILSLLASVFGLVLSISFDNLSTTPTQILLLAGMLLCYALIKKGYSHFLRF